LTGLAVQEGFDHRSSARRCRCGVLGAMHPSINCRLLGWVADPRDGLEG
jgi:hypothetical protein